MKKTCTKCNKTKPATAEYFYRKKDKLQAMCKECKSEIDKEQHYIRMLRKKTQPKEQVEVVEVKPVIQEPIIVKVEAIAKPTGKVRKCVKCNKTKDITEFRISNGKLQDQAPKGKPVFKCKACEEEERLETEESKGGNVLELKQKVENLQGTVEILTDKLKILAKAMEKQIDKKENITVENNDKKITITINIDYGRKKHIGKN